MCLDCLINAELTVLYGPWLSYMCRTRTQLDETRRGRAEADAEVAELLAERSARPREGHAVTALEHQLAEQSSQVRTRPYT